MKLTGKQTTHSAKNTTNFITLNTPDMEVKRFQQNFTLGFKDTWFWSESVLIQLPLLFTMLLNDRAF